MHPQQNSVIVLRHSILTSIDDHCCGKSVLEEAINAVCVADISQTR